jgi:putative ABC transport system permease protein
LHSPDHEPFLWGSGIIEALNFIALKMLLGDRLKYAGLLFGITFTSFLVTFAASYFGGMMTRSFALVAENSRTDVWVMDPAVVAVEPSFNLPASALNRVRSVEGVRSAMPLALATADARFPNGRFQSFQVIGVDDATLSGVPLIQGDSSASVLRTPDAVIVDSGGTSGKLETPQLKADQWPYGKPHLDVPTRPLAKGDELLVNDTRVRIAGVSQGLPRFPPRPLLFATYSTAERILLPERRRLTFVLVTALPGIDPRALAARIEKATGLRARASEDFKADTVRWMLRNSEDVGDAITMLTIAMLVGFGVTGVMMFMFTTENLKFYAVLNAMGATSRALLGVILVQAGLCALIGTGLGLGVCAIAGRIFGAYHFPYRMMWFAPVLGGVAVVLVTLAAAALSIWPVLKMRPASFLAGR